MTEYEYSDWKCPKCGKGYIDHEDDEIEDDEELTMDCTHCGYTFNVTVEIVRNYVVNYDE